MQKIDSIICEFRFYYLPLHAEDLFPFKSLHFEALHGDKEGRFSVKANDQYRVEFTLTETNEEPVATICNIMELSNHYK